MLRLPLTLLIIQLLACQLVTCADWSYKYSGVDDPLNWPTRYHKFCSGRRQSPVNLKESEAVRDRSLIAYGVEMPEVAGHKYWLGNYGNKLVMDFRGLAINVTFDNDTCYRPHSMHWHWGSVSNQGSEHRVEGRQYPMEGHIVMWNCRFYDNFDHSFGEVDGIAVLGVLYEEAAAAGSASMSDGLTRVTDGVANPNVTFCTPCNLTNAANGSVSTGVYIDAFNLTELLPSDMSKYFMYFGSLTTPTCMEGLIWTVYATPVAVPASVLSAFRSVQHSDGEFMSDNFRPVQSLNPDRPTGPTRVVSRSFDVVGDPSSAPAAAGTLALVVVVASVAAVSADALRA